jgi:hypothetical protein
MISTLQKLPRSDGSGGHSAFACEEKPGTAQSAAKREIVFTMAKCEVCENDYDKTFEVVVAGKPSHLR